MPTPLHPHRHQQAGHAHPPAALSPSFLRASVGQRLLVAALLSAAIWGCLLWAMT